MSCYVARSHAQHVGLLTHHYVALHFLPILTMDGTHPVTVLYLHILHIFTKAH